MIDLEFGMLVDKPVEEVFKFLSDPLNIPKWQAMIASIEQMTPGAVGLGSKFSVHAALMGRALDGVMEITSYEPPNKFGFTNKAGPMQVTVTITLKPAGTGTKVSLQAQGNPEGVFKLAEGPLTHQIKSQMEANLAKLKTLLESLI
jgi:carbon monoxide dehydrogenase subunit G